MNLGPRIGRICYKSASKTIDRLTEYRTALITAATTGKIDVRRVKIPQAACLAMPLNAQGYFNALRSYLNTAHYEVTETDGGRIVLKEKVFVRQSPKPVEYRVRLSVTGEALVINLDKKKPSQGNLSRFFIS